MKLSKTEEKLMQILWKEKKAFLNDFISAYKSPKPAKSTVATLLKRMQAKGFVAFNQIGRSREYYPLKSKKTYYINEVNGLVKKTFNNSPSQLMSFFVEKNNFTKEELDSLKKIIDNQIEQK